MFIPTNLLWTCDRENSNSVWGKWKCYCSESHDCGLGCLMFMLESLLSLFWPVIWMSESNKELEEHWHCSVCLLTTQMLRVCKLANSVTSQVMLLPLQSASVALMPSVSVAYFTFCRPLAQADEHTSHRKTRTAVTTKSWKRRGTHQLKSLIFSESSIGKLWNTHKNGPKVRVLVDVHVA